MLRVADLEFDIPLTFACLGEPALRGKGWDFDI
jgi:hypothetical protein